MKYYIYLLLILVLASCQEFDYGYSTKDIAYTKAFKNEFPNIDPSHSFGFIAQEIIDYPETRAITNPNSNEWETTFKLDVPDQVTEAEAEYVKNWFATHKNPSSTSIHWEQFFIQYIDCKQPQMNELQVKCLDGSISHIYNFNNSTRAMQYVYEAGTEAWSYAANSATGKYYRQWDLYNIQYLSFTASDGNHYEGWYVGFDYETAKEGINETSGEYKQFVFRDGYYNDWIVKVNPGIHQGYPLTVRIMCEDLGGTFDWDFNDIVFDVTFLRKSGKVYATIVVQASGGTLPIYVGENSSIYEAHSLLKGSISTPIIHPEAPAIYTVEVNISSESNTANAKDIPIFVKNENAVYTINSNSSVAQKFACPDDVEWAEEMQNICDKYQNIPAWISKEDAFEDSRQVWTQNPHKP